MFSRVLSGVLLVLSVFSCEKETKKIIFISNSLIDCTGDVSRKCLQFKEESTKDWRSLYDAIQGFDYKEGFFYKLKVEVIKAANPSAGNASIKYKLIKVLEQSSVPFTLDRGSWFVTHLKELDSFCRHPFIKIDLSKNEISGNTGCNRFTAKIFVEQDKVNITEVSATEMLCKDGAVEKAFLEALNAISVYSLKNEKLQFLDKDNEVLLECEYLKSE